MLTELPLTLLFVSFQLYASAILAGLDPQFVEHHGKKVDAIMYDVAYEGNFASSRQRTSGPFFPGARHKSWFDGHSFASGLFPAANGKSQESSSEAVNCYYGVYLWSLARNGYLSSPADDTSSDTDFLLQRRKKSSKFVLSHSLQIDSYSSSHSIPTIKREREREE